MIIYKATQKGPLKVPGYIDPDDNTLFRVLWGAPTFMASTVYRAGDVIRPSVDNGYYYTCTVNGVSGATEPLTWGNTAEISGTASFTAVPWDLWLLPTETISTSVWTPSNVAITLTNAANDGRVTGIRINPFASTITEFEITNQVTKSTGESLSRSFKFTVAQQ